MPVIVMDCWEHSYYRDYMSNRKAYVFGMMKELDWNIVEERMKRFNEDINHWVNYDCVVINDDLEKCYDEIINFINNKISKLDHNYDRIKIEKHVEKLGN